MIRIIPLPLQSDITVMLVDANPQPFVAPNAMGPVAFGDGMRITAEYSNWQQTITPLINLRVMASVAFAALLLVIIVGLGVVFWPTTSIERPMQGPILLSSHGTTQPLLLNHADTWSNDTKGERK